MPKDGAVKKKDRTAVYHPTQYVFIPDDDQCYRACSVVEEFKHGEPGMVKYVDPEVGQSFKLAPKDSAQIQRMDKQSLRPIDDMVELKLLNDASLLHNLRKRYNQSEIYTNIGSILVSINPYEYLYDNAVYVEKYLRSSAAETTPPHIFKTAEDAFRMMMMYQKNQSAVITGESGAGKTEATKMFLHYIAERSSKNAELSGNKVDTGKLQKKILESNPFMESFGNAKTLRNDNSSRFGKLIELYFDTSKGIVNAARITTYLLEKSRVVKVNKGERNYHIFYQMCAAAMNDRADLRKELNLDSPMMFHYTRGTNESMEDLIIKDGNEIEDDSLNFKLTEKAMQVLNLSEEERDSVFKILAGILHLGNVAFKKGKNTFASLDKAVKDGPLKYAALHLGMDINELEKAVTERDLTNKNEVVHKALSVAEAVAARDALSKHLYANLFDWLVKRMNKALYVKDRVVDKAFQNFIGVLDIFGFEMFDINSFEQLCINYCNEKLQYFFNFHVFKREQEVYKEEGISAEAVGFSDNMYIVETIEGGGKSKQQGILGICDDQAWLESATDKQFLSHVLNNQNEYLKQPKPQEVRKKPILAQSFKLRHFAGEVHYVVDGFLEKNKDTLRVDLRRVAARSSHRILATMFPNNGEGVAGRNAKYRKTLGSKFKDNLNQLMVKLNDTNPQFVRTIKPNSLKRPKDFFAPMILKQLREAGLLEVCRIRKLGYPVRRSHKEFFQHYLCLSKGSKNLDELVKSLVDKDLLYGDHWQVGKTMMFMRAEQAEDLEQARMIALKDVLESIRRSIKAFLFRLNLRRAVDGMKQIRQAMRDRDGVALKKGLEFFQAKNLTDVPLIIDAMELMKELAVQLDILDNLEKAKAKGDVLEMKSFIEEANNNGLIDHPLVKECEEIIENIEKRKQILKELATAMTNEDIEALKIAIKLALSNKMEDEDGTKLAQKALATLQEREMLLAELQDAMDAMNGEAINRIINKLHQIGCPSNELMERAATLHNVIIETTTKRKKEIKKLEKGIKKAMADQNLEKLKDLQKKAYDIQYWGDLLKDMNRMIIILERRAELFDEVENSTKALRRKMRSPEGIVVNKSKGRNDLKPLEHAISVCLEDNREYENEVEIKNGKALLVQAEEQLKAQIFIADTLDKFLNFRGDVKDNPAFDRLETALQKVQKLGLQTADADTVVREYRKIEALKAFADMLKNTALRQEKISMLRDPTEEEREDHVLDRAEKVYGNDFKRRAAEAYANPEFALRKYYRLRSDADFVEFEDDMQKEDLKKKKLMAYQLPISKSMLEVDADQEKIALTINRNILQYCGDIRVLRNLENRAFYIIVQGMCDEVLGDEIFLQLCKHVTGNPEQDSAMYAWKLMCQCATFFSCSVLFEPYFLHFLMSHQNDTGLEGNYARYVLAQLSSSMMIHHKNFKPQGFELSAYLRRPPVLAQIERVDGHVIEVPVLPDLRLKPVLKMIRRITKLKDNLKKPEWAIYVQALPFIEIDFRERVRNFFRYYNKEKLYKVDKFVEHWKDDQENFFKKLVETYGEEPAPAHFVNSKKALAERKKKSMRQDDESEMDDNISTFSGRSSRSVGSRVSGVSRRLRGGLFKTMKRDKNKKKKKMNTELVAPTVAWPLPWWVHLGDVVAALFKQDRVPKLTFKRRVLPMKGTPDKFVYHQLVREFKAGNLPVDGYSKTARMAVVAFAVDCIEQKKQVPIGNEDQMRESGLLTYIPAPMRRDIKGSEWLQKAVRVNLEEYNNSAKKLKHHFYKLSLESPLYGMSFFIGKVIKGNVSGKVKYLSHDSNMINDNLHFSIGVNQKQMVFQRDNKIEYSVPLSAIREIGTKDGGIFWMKADKTKFQTHLGDGERDSDEWDDMLTGDRNSIAGSQISSVSKAKKTKKKGKAVKKNRFGNKNELVEIYTLQPKEMFDIVWLFLHLDRD